jgi:SAM-dependent methyltransferase
MTEQDLSYVRRLIQKKVITGSVLELGAGYGGDTCEHLITEKGLQYYSTDITSSSGVDYVADFESDDIFNYFPDNVRFKTVLILNVLEHTFDPIRVLDNARKILDQDGSLVLITPCVWTLHKYPIDCYRLLPNFYERYAESRKMNLDLTCFEYIEHGPIASNRDANGDYRLPLPALGFSYWKSKVVHQLFNTFGRGMYCPSHVAIGAVISLNGSINGQL